MDKENKNNKGNTTSRGSIKMGKR